jgi:hypothetical protein
MMVRLIVVALVTATAGCAAPHERANLGSVEVIRIAELKARSSEPDLIHYSRSSPCYDAADDSWWVTYHRKIPGHHVSFAPYPETMEDFSVQVDAKTRKAWLWLP